MTTVCSSAARRAWTLVLWAGLAACAGAPGRSAAPTAPAALPAAAPLAAGSLLGGDARDAYARAEAHRARGKALYETQRFEDAIVEFAAGYEAAPWPVFLFNIGQARRQLGDCRAVFSFRRFLAEIDQRDPEDPARVVAEPGISVARRNLAALEPTCVTAMKLPTAPRPRRWYERRAVRLAMLGGVAVAGLGGGALLFGEERAQRAHQGTSLSEVDRDVSLARRWRIAGGALLGLGAALTLGSYLHHRIHPSLVDEITIEVGGRAAIASLTGRF